MELITNESTKVDVLAKAVQDLSVSRTLEAVMKVVRKAARRIAGAQGATFVLREAEHCFYADEDAITPLWKGKRFPLEQCITGWVMKHREIVTIEDILADERIPQDIYKKTFVKSLAVIPIRTIDPIGAIGCYWAGKKTPAREELILLQSLADVTAVRIENIQMHNELEQRVNSRTLELENANKELESFSYSISHDLRAPLRGIYGYMSILMEDHEKDLTEEVRSLARKVMNNSQQMSMLIEGLLTFFKMGRKDMSKTRVPMKAVVSGICRSLLENEEWRDISIEIKDLPMAFADHTLISQVWMNLISNAIKYTGKKEKSVIEIGCQQVDNETIYFVKDNGAGFDMEFQEKLFQVFQRLHSQREFEGTGIGLAISQKIVTRHGGRIWASGVQGEGATFYFTIS